MIAPTKTQSASSTTSAKPSAPPLPTSSLHLGSKGAEVAQLQRALTELGFSPGPADGIFGAQTQSALMAYERKSGLLVNGLYAGAVRESMTNAFNGIIAPVGASRQGDSGTKVRRLERTLSHLGFDVGTKDGKFDAQLATALKQFQKQQHLVVDGVYGEQSRFALRRALITNKDMAELPAPKADYRRLHVRGVTMNARTLQMLERAEEYAGRAGIRVPFGVVQGSYSTSVGASAGTHAGGGALDLSVSGLSHDQVKKMVKALRMAGFAAWSRGQGFDSFSPHIHVIAIGDREMSSQARDQVADYFAGRNGLADNGPDRDAIVGRPYPGWAAKFRG